MRRFLFAFVAVLAAASVTLAVPHKVAVHKTSETTSNIWVQANAPGVLGCSWGSEDCPDYTKGASNPWGMFYELLCDSARTRSALVCAGSNYMNEGQWYLMATTDKPCPALWGVEVGEDWPVSVLYYCGGGGKLPWELEKSGGNLWGAVKRLYQ